MESVRLNALGQPIGFDVLDWTPPVFPPHTPMAGRHCRLEALSLAHAPALWEVFGLDRDGRNWTYLAQDPYARYADFEDWVGRSASSTDPQFYAILPVSSAASPAVSSVADSSVPSVAAAGVASYLRITPPAATIEVGHIHFSVRLQHTPAATEAMYLMMRRAFELGYRRYEWKCDALNAPSRRAAQRLGFSFEGVFRQALVTKGRNRDTAWYACIDKEWPSLRVAFETWLQPDNFDAEGRQRQSLSALTAPLLVARG
jgi:RimJ/RimL family protein N-acetyltransferase